MLKEEGGGEGKERVMDRAIERQAANIFLLSTPVPEIVCAQINRTAMSACLFDFDYQHQINFSECTFLSLAGYKKNCLCTVSTKQMGFCSPDFNTVTVSASVTITDCFTILMLGCLLFLHVEMTIMLDVEHV